MMSTLRNKQGIYEQYSLPLYDEDAEWWSDFLQRVDMQKSTPILNTHDLPISLTEELVQKASAPSSAVSFINPDQITLLQAAIDISKGDSFRKPLFRFYIDRKYHTVGAMCCFLYVDSKKYGAYGDWAHTMEGILQHIFKIYNASVQKHVPLLDTWLFKIVFSA